MEIDFEDFYKLEGEQLSYYGANQKLTTKNLTDPVVVYNGSVLGENLSAVMGNINKGKMTLKDSDGDKKYDIVMIEDYRGFVISSLNAANQQIYDKVGLSDDIDFEEYDTAMFFNSGGEKIAFGSLEVGQVLSVAASKDKKYIKVILERDTVTGTYSDSRVDGDTMEITVGSVSYKLDKTFVSYFKKICTIGSEYTFTKDSFGKIVYAEAPKVVLEYGYVIGAYKKDGFDAATVVKLMTKAGEIKIYECASKLTVDGARRTSDEVLGLLTNSDGSVNDVIRYSVSDDYISKIDTKNLGLDSRETSMYNIFEGNEKVSRWYNTKHLGIKCLLDSNTVIFCAPNNLSGAEDDDFFLAQVGELVSDKFYVSDAYKDGSTESFAGAVVIYYDSLTGWNNEYATQKKAFVVDEVSEQLYNGEIVTAIEGYERGAKSVVYNDEGMDFSGVEKGDILRLGYDRDGTLRRINNGLGYEIIYDCSTKSAPANWYNTATKMDSTADPTTGCLVYNLGGLDTEYYRSDYQISYGDVLAKRDNVLELNGTGGDVYTDCADVSGLPITVYDEAADTVSVGTINDIIDRESSGTHNSKVFLEQVGGMVRAVIVYNFK